MKEMLIGAALAAVWAVPAAQACTLKELKQKAELFTQKYQQLVDANAQRAVRIKPRAEEAAKTYREAVALARRGQHFNHICRLYDELLVALKTG
jgi:hypothetical protein